MGKTIAGEDEDLQNQKRIRGLGEDRENPPMPKSVESLQGRGFRNTKACSRVGAKANVRNVGRSCLKRWLDGRA
ncbi:hypothetical protein Taro_019726 [Colocasia esculenta]|uniref:Uncharacterized protein n=1 Tax=Colocasia esculenta TaxID=4460 RepID=A0A843ULT0_COLES|nr:hypothetical protein [Colocasia esculenta]